MTRLGLHVNDNDHTGKVVEYARRVRPNVMKLLDPNRAVVDAIRAASPGTKIIGRKYWADQRLDTYGDFRGAAVDLARSSGVDWMEGYNEWGAERELSSFAGAEVSLARDLNAHGIGALIGGFSTGYLDSTTGRAWEQFRPAFDYMRAVGPERCALHFHEYSAPYIQYGSRTPDGRNQWVNRRPDGSGGNWSGASTDPALYEAPDLDGWWVLRYRMLRRKLVAAGYSSVTFYITESGLDDIQPRPGGQGKGWRHWTGPEWTGLPGVGDIADQFAWFMRQVSRDPYVRGVVDFGFAARDPQWGSFDFSQTPREFERLMVTQAAIGGTPAPVPTPTPIPAPVPPAPAPTPYLPPRVTDAVSVVARAAAGESGPQFAARMRGQTEGVPGMTAGQWYALRAAWWAEVKRHNGLTPGAGLTAGALYRSPWHKPEVSNG